MGRASLKSVARATAAYTAATATTAITANTIREGSPVNAVASSLTTALDGDNNDLVFTAKVKGADGDNITVAYSNPGVPEAELVVTVEGTAITVSLATDAASAITTTANSIITEIEGDPVAAALVSVANKEGNSGEGVVTAMDATPLANGVDGTVGVKGEIYHDENKIYVCTADNTVNDANWRQAALS